MFYCGLRKNPDAYRSDGLYIIGYFFVEEAGTYKELAKKYDPGWIAEEFANNHHIEYKDKPERTSTRQDGSKFKTSLILIKGDKNESRLLEKAKLISMLKKDRGGHNLFVLDPELECHFGKFSKQNAIQRSTPRRVPASHIEKAAAFLEKLK